MKTSVVVITLAALTEHATAGPFTEEPISYVADHGRFGTLPYPYEFHGSHNEQWDNTTNQTYFIEAYRNPDFTRTVPFTLAGQEGWSWRINITDVSLPGATDGPDPHIVGTTHDLQWPNKTMNLREALSSLDPELDFAVEEGFGPKFYNFINYANPGVTNKFTETSNNTCENVIPEQCLQTIMDIARDGDGTSSSAFDNDLSEYCYDVFQGLPHFWYPREMTREAHFVLQNGEFGAGPNDTNRRITEERPLNNSDAFWSSHTESYGESNSTAIEQQKSRLNVLVISWENRSEALCARIDPRIDDKDVSPHRFTWEGSSTATRVSVLMAGLTPLSMIFLGLI
ncbi:hypothetical protein Q7P37_010892 [Cladosporium fusiforme]